MKTDYDHTMLFDSTSCIGCEACTAVCKIRYDSPWGVFRTKISRTQTGSHPDSRTRRYKVACQHCKKAACVKACPSKALGRVRGVAVVLDPSGCIGCGYCSAACPYGVAKFDRARGKAADKCSFCFKLVPENKPFCVSACPVAALSFGPRPEIIEQANVRIAHLKGRGVKNTRIYGVQELGGLGVISVLAGEPAEYGIPEKPRIPWGHKSWRHVLRPGGGIAAAAAVAAILSNWISTRKGRVPDSSRSSESSTGRGEE